MTTVYGASVLELSTQVLCMTDLEGIVVWCNDAMIRACGDAAGELVGRPMVALVHPEDAGALAAARTTLASGREVSGLQVRHRDGEGTWRWLEWTMRADLDRRLARGAVGGGHARSVDPTHGGCSQARPASRGDTPTASP